MVRGVILSAVIIGLAGMASAQKPHAQPHHPQVVQHKAAPVPLPKGGGGANGTDVQLKRLEQQTAKTAGTNPQKQKAAAPVKFKPEPVGAKKNPPIDFKPQHAQKKPAAAPVQRNTLHAKH